jgi:hypothetical protein
VLRLCPRLHGDPPPHTHTHTPSRPPIPAPCTQMARYTCACDAGPASLGILRCDVQWRLLCCAHSRFCAFCSGQTLCISGLVVEYVVAIDVTRVRFPADALCSGTKYAPAGNYLQMLMHRTRQGILYTVRFVLFFGGGTTEPIPTRKELYNSI